MKQKPLMLVIDDLKSNRMIIKKVLKDDYDYIEASDGLEAFELLNKYTPDIILIDAIMPKMDGFETIKKIREQKKYKRVPILMITSLNNLKMKIKALEYGVNDFLTKPFDKYELRARCKSYSEMVKINKQFTDAKINPITGFENEFALIKDLVPSNGLFLININDFHKIKGIYGYKNSQIVEKKFGDFILATFKKYIQDIKLYHITSAKFAIKVDPKIDFDDKVVKNICEKFYNECMSLDIFIDDIKFTPIVTIVFAKDRINLYEDAMSALGYAKLHNLRYIYNPDDINGIRDIVYSNIEILKKVKNAIDEKNIINFYQPIMDNHQDKVNIYETLVRIRSKNGEMLSPSVFLDVTKNVQLYEHITKTVYKNAFDKFKFNQKEFSINISYLDIKNQSVREYLFDILKQNPHVSNRIIFEILQDIKIKDFGLIKEFIAEVKKYEVKIAIDDVGKDYFNFQNIVEIEPDFLKIDGSIVKDILTDSKSYNLVDSINKFSHNLGIQTIAEYVSNKEIYNEILNMDVDFSQGFFIGKPSQTLLTECALSI